MQSFIINPVPSAFTLAMQNIQRGRKMTSEGKKLDEIGKAYLSQFLLESRKLEIGKLPIGELVQVNSGLLVIQIDKQNRFDVEGFAALHPDLYTRFKKDFPIVKYKV